MKVLKGNEVLKGTKLKNWNLKTRRQDRVDDFLELISFSAIFFDDQSLNLLIFLVTAREKERF